MYAPLHYRARRVVACDAVPLPYCRISNSCDRGSCLQRLIPVWRSLRRLRTCLLLDLRRSETDSGILGQGLAACKALRRQTFGRMCSGVKTAGVLESKLCSMPCNQDKDTARRSCRDHGRCLTRGPWPYVLYKAMEALILGPCGRVSMLRFHSL